MRRGDLWPRAVEQALKVIADCRPADQLAVFSFDTECHPLLTFHESETLDPARRDAIARGGESACSIMGGWRTSARP